MKKKDENTLLKITIKDDEKKEINRKNEKHDHQKTLKSVEFHNDFYRNKYESLNKKKILLTKTEFLIRSDRQ